MSERVDMPPARAPLRVGKYEVLRHLASGGMAEIHLARSRGIEGFEKLVVVKRMLPTLIHKPDYVQMFLEEARLAARLQHSNIVQVYDIGSDDGEYYFVMEYLHGVDLGRLLQALLEQGRRLPLDVALYIAQGLCAGLHHAHELVGDDGQPLHVVHRDISPQNVLLTYDGGVKVVDFGIAKAATRLSRTRAGALKGKVPYMSPEQCRALPLDRRSDVYSTAILLWEMATTRRLYRGGGEFDLMKQIVEKDAPPVRSVIAELPEELERVLARGLARDREARYRSTQDLQVDVEALAREEHLTLSPIALARLLKELFADRLAAFAEAQQGGRDLAAHIAAEYSVGESVSVTMEHEARWNSDESSAETTPAHSLQSFTDAHDETEATVVPPRRARLGIYVALALGFALLCSATALGVKLWRRAHAPSQITSKPLLLPPEAALAPPTTAPAPPTTAPAPSATAPAPSATAPAPSATAPAPSATAPAPSTTAPALSATAPAPAATAPAPSASASPGTAPGHAAPARRKRKPGGEGAPSKSYDPDSPLPP